MSTDPAGAERTHVLVCSEDNQAVETLSKVFSSLASYELTVVAFKKLSGRKQPDPEQFDIAILDIGDGQILADENFSRLRQKFSGIPVLFLSDELAQDQLREIVKLDVADWLQKPLQSKPLIEAVTSVLQRQRTLANKVHAIVPCGGGSGATLVAIMLGYFCSRRMKRTQPTSAIFDLDFSGASVSNYLNIISDFDLSTVVGNPDRVDLEFIDFLKKKHESGVSVFSFESLQFPASDQASELILRMLDLVSFQHDHTIVDLPSNEMPWHNNILKAVDTVTIVSGVSVPSLQRAKQAVRRIEKFRGDSKNIRVIVNRAKSSFFGLRPRAKDLRKVFGDMPVIVLPDERETMLEALNRGVLPNEVDTRSSFSKKMQKYAELIRQGT